MYVILSPIVITTLNHNFLGCKTYINHVMLCESPYMGVVLHDTLVHSLVLIYSCGLAYASPVHGTSSAKELQCAQTFSISE